MTTKIIKHVKIIKKPKTIKKIKSDIYTITIESSSGESTIKGIAKLAKSFPGRYQLCININIPNLAKIDTITNQYVSMECINEIRKLFPSVQISSNTI